LSPRRSIKSPTARFSLPVDHTFKLGCGRVLGCGEAGDPHGKPVLYFHGFPGSRLEAGLAGADARKRGVRLIGIDRPGYGLSDPDPGRTLLDWPADVAELADALHLERFAVLGASGGGPYALACAFKMPDRLSSVGIACGLGPAHPAGHLESMRGFSRLGLKIAAQSPFLAHLIFVPVALWIRSFPGGLLSWVGTRAGEPDKSLLKRVDMREALCPSFRESLRCRLTGPVRDAVLYALPWGFKPEDIRGEVHIWHGERDLIVPSAMGHAMADALPNCRATFYKNEGHFSLLVSHLGDMLETLISPKAVI